MLSENFFGDEQGSEADGFDVAAVGIKPLVLCYVFRNSANECLDIKGSDVFVLAGSLDMEDVDFPKFDLSGVSIDDALEAVFENVKECCDLLGRDLQISKPVGPTEQAADSGP